MRARLLVIVCVLVGLLAVGLGVPLAIADARAEQQTLFTDRLTDTIFFASRAQRPITEDSAVGLAEELARYDEVYGVAVTIVDRSERVVAASRRDPPVLDAEGRTRLQVALASRRSASYPLLLPWDTRPIVLAEPVLVDGEVRGAAITVSPTGPLRERELRIWSLVAAAVLVALCLGVLVAVPLTRWILRPVAQLDGAAHRISAGTLDARVPSGLGPPELRRLARSFNTMADDVTDALERQRAFVAQASHQLRNPLTALRLRVEELAAFIAEAAGRDEHRLALEEADRLRRILDGLLALAQAERGHHRTETEDAATVADERVAAWQPLAQQRGITLRRTGADRAPVVAVPTAVGQALDALIDNALKFAGPHATVEVAVRPGPSSVAVHVTDDGPGLADTQRRRATERFWRAPDAQNVDGSGLGLPIAIVLVEASGGDLALSAVEPRGLDARLRFPATASPPGSNGRHPDAAEAEDC